MKVFRAISHFFVWLCMFFILALMLLMVTDVVLITFFKTSIIGTTEWAAMLLLFELTAMGASILSNRMIKVNMVTQYFSKKAQAILDVVIVFLCCGVIGFTSWRQFEYSIQSLHNGVKYATIGLPQWPFIALFGMAYGVAAITALAVVIRKIINICKGKYLLEAEIEDMDPIFVFGKRLPAKIQALIDGKSQEEAEELGAAEKKLMEENMAKLAEEQMAIAKAKEEEKAAKKAARKAAKEAKKGGAVK